MVASVTTLMGALLRQRDTLSALFGKHAKSSLNIGWDAINGLGLFSALMWFYGFVLFTDWILKLPGQRVALLTPLLTHFLKDP